MPTLPIRTLTLYKQGIGYFERAGTFHGTTLSLTVPRESTNDVLKSLHVTLADGDTLNSVDYETPDDKQHILDQLAVKVGNVSSLSDLLTSLRGYVVTCQQQEGSITGRIVGVDSLINRDVPVLVLQTDAGIDTLTLTRIEQLMFADQRARDALAFFLDVSQTEQQNTTLTLRFDDGDHHASLHYLAPSPTWRMSYRLNRNEAGETHLEAWGLFDNALDEDLDDVQVTLISGRPISFEYELYETMIPRRPQVSDIPVDESQPVHDQGFRDFVSTISHELRTPITAMGGYSDLLMRGFAGELTAEQKQMVTAINENTKRMTEHLNDLLDAVRLKDDTTGRYYSASSAGPLGDLKVSGSYFAPVDLAHAEPTYLTYPIAKNISVKRGQSAIVPIFNVAVPCDVLRVYNGDKMNNHPLLVWRITNTSGVVLEQGPATLSENERYCGEGLMRFTGVNEQRELAYALEYSILVTEENKQSTEQCITYSLHNRSQQAMTILIERRISPHAEYIDSPEPIETFGTHHRWNITIEAQSTHQITLHERTIRANYHDLKTYSSQLLRDVQSANLLSAEQDSLLTRLIELHGSYKQIEIQLQTYQHEYTQLLERQEQLRKNLSALGQTEREISVRNSVLDDLERSEERRRTIEHDVAQLNQQLQTIENERQSIYAELMG